MDKNILSLIGRYKNIGLLDSVLPNTLSVLNNKEFVPKLIRNKNITGLIVSEEISNIVSKNIECYISSDPFYDFFTLFNHFYKSNKSYTKSLISKSAEIHESAFIAEMNVVINEGVRIGANAVILEDVTIGMGTIIGEGSVLGSTSIEAKATSQGIIDVLHNRNVEIGREVMIGANCTIDKGIYDRDTLIGDETRLGNNTMIYHGSQIGKKCLIISCTICGSATIEDGVRINPGSTISSKILVKENSTVTLGSVVMSTVESGTRVSGNFAINHERYLSKFVKAFGPINSKK